MSLLPLLRIVTGLMLLASVLLAGAYPRSPWIILPLALVFTVAFIVGRWRAWSAAFTSAPSTRLIGQLAATVAVQGTMVAVLYLIGRGAAAILGRADAGAFDSDDAAYCGIVAVLGIGLGGIAVWRERHAPFGIAPAVNDGGAGNAGTSAAADEIRLRPEPVTLQSLFAGIHYTHARYDEQGRIYNGTPNADSAGSMEKIATAEARLGITMPTALREVYLTQNGGSIGSVCVPKAGVGTPRRYDDVVMPFSGYDDLLPCEKLRTVFDAATDCADPDDPEQSDMFPEGCSRFIVLSQWYRQTLFLDCSAGDEPSVVFVDFDHVDWQAHGLRWPSFGAFFAALRHYDTL